MAFKTMDDIERDKNKEERVKMRKDISEDINEVIGNINILKKTPKKKKRGIFGWIILTLLGLLLGVIVVNFILGNIWLLKFLIKNLFGI